MKVAFDLTFPFASIFSSLRTSKAVPPSLASLQRILFSNLSSLTHLLEIPLTRCIARSQRSSPSSPPSTMCKHRANPHQQPRNMQNRRLSSPTVQS